MHSLVIMKLTIYFVYFASDLNFTKAGMSLSLNAITLKILSRDLRTSSQLLRETNKTSLKKKPTPPFQSEENVALCVTPTTKAVDDKKRSLHSDRRSSQRTPIIVHRYSQGSIWQQASARWTWRISGYWPRSWNLPLLLLRTWVDGETKGSLQLRCSHCHF